jgi:hypothetical protein
VTTSIFSRPGETGESRNGQNSDGAKCDFLDVHDLIPLFAKLTFLPLHPHDGRTSRQSTGSEKKSEKVRVAWKRGS